MSTQDALSILEQQLFHQGRLDAARAALRRILACRNLQLEVGDEERIEACRDLATLERWHEQALTATTAADALS